MSITSFFYSKKNLSIGKIHVENIDFHCDDIGMCSLSRIHDFEYRHVSTSSDVLWEDLLNETFNLTFLRLLGKKIISVDVVNFQESYFGNFYSHKKRVFSIKKERETDDNDFFSNVILEVIGKLLKKNKGTVYLHQVITEIYNVLIGEYEHYLKPEKQMLLRILNLYTEKYDWLKFDEDYSLLGTQFKHKINIEPIYIPRLKMQYNDISDFQKKTLKGNAPYMQFKRRIGEVLEFNNHVRYLLYSRGNNRYDNGVEFDIPTNF